MPARTPEQIWAGDLFDRQSEARLLIGYIESLAARQSVREDKRASTIAVDASYGEGKTFFLTRLAEHLSINHPVAFVDAWADDLANEPFTALAATLKAALEPFLDDAEVKTKLATFMEKSGKVAKIAAVGLVKRGVALAITGAAVDAASGVISDVGDDVKDALNDQLKDGATGTVNDLATGITSIGGHALMERRILAFEEGKRAVAELKTSLEAIVASLPKLGLEAPIVIVIDELDRCRPTYAIKLLEEIKHLFDVPGLVFVMGMHAEQLGHSVAGAYGPNFNGWAYLRRFLNRQYVLAAPDLEPLLQLLFSRAGVESRRLTAPPVAYRESSREQLFPYQLIARYMREYSFSARDAFEVVDVIQTTLAVVTGNSIALDYFVPLLLAKMRGYPRGEILPLQTEPKWVFLSGRFDNVTETNFYEQARLFQDAARMSNSQLNEMANSSEVTRAHNLVWQTRTGDEGAVQPLFAVENYPRLLEIIGRFSSPERNEGT
jgi:hypothetical protein